MEVSELRASLDSGKSSLEILLFPAELLSLAKSTVRKDFLMERFLEKWLVFSLSALVFERAVKYNRNSSKD